MSYKKILSVALVSTSMLLLAACSSGANSKTASKQVINWSEKSELPTMDISLATDEISMDMLNNTNEGLVRLGKNNKIESGIAQKITESKDGLHYTFDLRKNAKWSNGDPVTAKDFVYSWQRTNNPKTGSQYAYLFSGVKNADAIQAGKKKASTLGVKADGNYKLKVTLEKPISYFKLLLGFPSYLPQNQKVVEKYGSKYGTAAKYQVYNGPFKMTGWTGSNLKWSLVKNTNYWDKKNVKLAKINDQVIKDTQTGLNQFQSGQVDVTALSGTQVKNLKSNKSLVVRKQARNAYVEYNISKNKALKSLKVRQALSYAIDRNQLTKNVLADGSSVPKGFVTDKLASNPKTGEDFATEAYTKNGVSYNLDQAKTLWKDGLKESGKTSLTLTLLTDDSDSDKKTAEYLQSALQKLPGLKINIETVPYKTRLSRSVKGDFDLVITLWGADFSDPISDIGLMTSKNTFNNGKWSNKEFDSLIDKANNADSNDPTARWNDMVAAEKILMNDQGVAPLYNVVVAQMVNTKIKGLVYNTAGVPYNFKSMYVAK